MEASRKSKSVLVVGAGIAGAAFVWTATRAGMKATLVSADRPASQATALIAGIVHGLGPPGNLLFWSRLPREALMSAGKRARYGYNLLREVLLGGIHPSGLARYPHQVQDLEDTSPTHTNQLVATLQDAGFPVRRVSEGEGPVLVRDRDAVLNPRRLTFELLRQARNRGARIQLGRGFRGILEESPEGVLVDFPEGSEHFDLVCLAGGKPMDEGPVASFQRTRIVLHQVFTRGSKPLGKILEAANGDVILSPAPLRPDHVILVRMAEENDGGGLSWPTPPRSWEVFRGQAIRQRLSEALCAPPDRPLSKSPKIVNLVGCAFWPLAPLLGACHEALSAAGGPGRKS